MILDENGENGIWSHVDTRKFGRCFTAKPNEEISKKGIEKIVLILKEESKIYFHTPGMLFTDQELTSISIFFRKKMKITLEYELYKVLDMDGDQCNHVKDYAKDACVIEEADQKSMTIFGCTTPFGFEKDMICQDQANATKVLDLYIKAFEGKQEHECMHPCNFIKPRAIITEEKNMPLVGFGSFTHKYETTISNIHEYNTFDLFYLGGLIWRSILNLISKLHRPITCTVDCQWWQKLEDMLDYSLASLSINWSFLLTH